MKGKTPPKKKRLLLSFCWCIEQNHDVITKIISPNNSLVPEPEANQEK